MTEDYSRSESTNLSCSPEDKQTNGCKEDSEWQNFGGTSVFQKHYWCSDMTDNRDVRDQNLNFWRIY